MTINKLKMGNPFQRANWLLIIVLVIAGVLRLWNLGSVPPGITPDEASLGYNAYSILKTGQDEYGKSFPIIFKSFGDYKPGLYIYLAVPSVALFGLNEFSVRIPSALAGILSVYLIYLISKKLFTGVRLLPTVAALVAATNPYLIYFSRGAWEANISLCLTLFGIYFFLKALEYSRFILHSSLFFALTLLTYQGAKLSTAIVIVILICVYWKEFFSIGRKYLIAGALVGILVALPIFLSLFNGQTGRLAVFSIFSYRRPPEETQKYVGPFYYLFHSEPLNYVRAIGGRWFNDFSGKFLFFEGDMENPISTAPYQGVLLLSGLIFLPMGLYVVFKEKLKRGQTFLILWLIAAPFSAAISRDTTNAIRSLNMAVPLIIIIAFGLNHFIGKSVWMRLLAFTIYAFAFVYFIDAYFVHVPAHNSSYWRYGYREVVETVTPLEAEYQKIVVEQSFNQPYIYFLFYNPGLRDNIVLENSANIKDVGLVSRLGKIEFRQIDWEVIKKEHGTLVVLSPTKLPPDYTKDASLVREIKYLNGRDVAFNIVEIN